MGSKHGVLGGCREHCRSFTSLHSPQDLSICFPSYWSVGVQQLCWVLACRLLHNPRAVRLKALSLLGITASTDGSGGRYKGSAPDYFRTMLKGHPSSRTLRGIGWSFPRAASQFTSPSTLSCSLASAAVLIPKTRLHRLPTCRSHCLHPREPSFTTAGTRGGPRKQILKHDLRAGSLAVSMASLVAGEHRHAGAMWLKLRHYWVRMDGVLMERCALEGATWQLLNK